MPLTSHSQDGLGNDSNVADPHHLDTGPDPSFHFVFGSDLLF